MSELLSSNVVALRTALLGFETADPNVAVARQQVLELLDRVADPAVRSTRPGHLTGSAFVVSADGEWTLLLHHAKLARWLQPGGHADGDLDLARVALREATEETGIAGLVVDPEILDVDVHEVRPPSEDAHLHFDVRYLVTAPVDAHAVGNHESTDLRWVALDRISDLTTEESVLRLARSARRRLGNDS